MTIERLRGAIPLGLLAWLAHIAWTYPVFTVTYGLVGVVHGCIYALIGVGFATVYRVGRFINFAHGDVFMLGSVAAVWLGSRVVSPGLASASPVLVLAATALFAVVVGACVSAACQMLVFGRLQTAPTLVAVVASVGVALVLQNIGIKWNGSGTRKFTPLIEPAQTLSSLGGVLPHVVASLALSLPLLAAAVFLASRTQWGRALQAASDDPDAARLMGINVARTVLLAFVFAGACAGAAGVAFAQEFHAVSYSTGMKVGLVAYASAIIGGVGRTAGTVVGGFLIGVVESLNNLKPAALGSNWSQTVIFSVMILMLVYKPEGLLGHASDERV